MNTRHIFNSRHIEGELQGLFLCLGTIYEYVIFNLQMERLREKKVFHGSVQMRNIFLAWMTPAPLSPRRFGLDGHTRCELWELELLDCKAVSDNKCQEEVTRGASDMDGGAYPNRNLC